MVAPAVVAVVLILGQGFLSQHFIQNRLVTVFPFLRILNIIDAVHLNAWQESFNDNFLCVFTQPLKKQRVRKPFPDEIVTIAHNLTELTFIDGLIKKSHSTPHACSIVQAPIMNTIKHSLESTARHDGLVPLFANASTRARVPDSQDVCIRHVEKLCALTQFQFQLVMKVHPSFSCHTHAYPTTTSPRSRCTSSDAATCVRRHAPRTFNRSKIHITAASESKWRNFQLLLFVPLLHRLLQLLACCSCCRSRRRRRRRCSRGY